MDSKPNTGELSVKVLEFNSFFSSYWEHVIATINDIFKHLNCSLRLD